MSAKISIDRASETLAVRNPILLESESKPFPILGPV